MKKIFKMLGLTFLIVTAAVASQREDNKNLRLHSVRENIDKEALIQKKPISMTDNIKHMFKDGKVSGQIRMMYAGYEQKELNVDNNYATAIGGKLKYELAELNGFNAGIAFYTSHDINFATGDNTQHNNELSSNDGSYT